MFSLPNDAQRCPVEILCALYKGASQPFSGEIVLPWISHIGYEYLNWICNHNAAAVQTLSRRIMCHMYGMIYKYQYVVLKF